MEDTKTFYVYEIINDNSQVEYVGYTTKITGHGNRFYQHTKVKPGHSGHGAFYGRTDITFNIAYETESKRDALDMEGLLKLSYGLEWTERLSPRALNNRQRKLNNAQALEIRSKYIPKKYTMMKLAAEYDVSFKTIHNIINGVNYKC